MYKLPSAAFRLPLEPLGRDDLGVANSVCLHSCCHLTFGNLARGSSLWPAGCWVGFFFGRGVCGNVFLFGVELVSSPDRLLQTPLLGLLTLQGTELI